MLPIEQSCYWFATRKKFAAQSRSPQPQLQPKPQSQPQPQLQPKPQPHLDQSSTTVKLPSRTKIAIVGAGFTGLWTAYFLKQLSPETDITIVEQGDTGYGASGRNAGMISNCIDHTHGLAISHFGLEEAKKLARLGLQNIDEMSAYATDCDLERNGQLFVALSEKHLTDFEELLETAQTVGIEGYKLLDAGETREKLNSPLYLGSAYVPGGGILNPIKLIDKLTLDLVSRGVKILEQTKVTSVSRDGLETSRGKLSADRTILATDAYSHHLLPGLLWRFIPLYDYILVSEPLSSAQLNSIGWSGREGIVDGRSFFNYYRLTADNRILWGTSEARYYAPNKVGPEHDHCEPIYADLVKSFARHFPQLADSISWPYRWGGPIASTTRLTPFFGTAHDDRVLYALGYTGHGIGSTRLAGRILAHMASGTPSELTALKMVTDKPFPYPPEPLRSLSVKLVTDSLRHVDQGANPNLILKALDVFGLGFSS